MKVCSKFGAHFLFEKNQTLWEWHSSNVVKGGNKMDSYSIEQTNHSYEVIIDELMTDYGQQILQLVMQYVHNAAIAEDLTQEIFVKCYQALPTFHFNSSVKTWLWRIAINHTKDYLKSWYAKNVETNFDGIWLVTTSRHTVTVYQLWANATSIKCLFNRFSVKCLSSKIVFSARFNFSVKK